jgi:hypothetical protein
MEREKEHHHAEAFPPILDEAFSDWIEVDRVQDGSSHTVFSGLGYFLKVSEQQAKLALPALRLSDALTLYVPGTEPCFHAHRSVTR